MIGMVNKILCFYISKFDWQYWFSNMHPFPFFWHFCWLCFRFLGYVFSYCRVSIDYQWIPLPYSKFLISSSLPMVSALLLMWVPKCLWSNIKSAISLLKRAILFLALLNALQQRALVLMNKASRLYARNYSMAYSIVFMYVGFFVRTTVYWYYYYWLIITRIFKTTTKFI